MKTKILNAHAIRTCLGTLLLSGGLAAGPSVLAGPEPQPGWPATAGGPVRGAVALGNLAGDARLEAVVGAMDSKLYSLNADGTAVTGNWPATLAGNVVSAPALADFDRDGFLEIVVMTHNGYVYLLRGSGSVMPGWPQTVPASYAYNYGLSPSPVLADLDGDGDLEILVTSASQMDVFETNGSRWGGNWPVYVSADYGLLATPAVADLDDDGQLEIVMCARSTWTGTVYAFETDGTYVSGFNQFRPGNYIDAAPVIVDFDGDGFKDIVICGEYDDNQVYLLDHQGNLKPGWPVATRRHQTPPAIGDVDGDGQLEIVVANRDNPDGPGSGWIYAIKRDRSFVPGFPLQVVGHFDRSAPALADVDGDGLPEIIAGNLAGNLYAVDGNGTVMAGWPFATGGAIESSAALGDTDLDGRLEAVFGSDDGKIYCLDLGAGSLAPGRLAWPTFHYNNQRTGFFDPSGTNDLDGWVWNLATGTYYKLTEGLTWTEAQALAQSWGGNLVTINDAAENEWVCRAFGTNELFWIGFSDQAEEGTWVWASGEPVTYQNWGPAEPNDLFGEDYACINYWESNYPTPGYGFWNDYRGPETVLRGIVERSGPATAPLIASIPDQVAPEGVAFVGPTPVLIRGNAPITWLLMTGPAGMTIDPTNGVASWSAPVLAGSPHSVTIRATNTTGYDDESFVLTVRSATNDLPGWVWNPTTGNYYKLTEVLTWTEAQAVAVSWGGNLVTINDVSENEWVCQTFGIDEFFWIGFTDENHEGVWSWISEEPVSYTNWLPGQPDNFASGGEQYASTFRWSYDPPSVYGFWNDNGSGVRMRGIVERSGPGTSPLIAHVPGQVSLDGVAFVGPIPVLIRGDSPITWLLMAGPAGMTIDPTTGVISWSAPLLAGTPYNVTIRATNATGYDDESFLLTVRPADSGAFRARWEPIATTGNSPSPRYGASLVFVPNPDRLVLFGGALGGYDGFGTDYNDLFVLDVQTRVWTQTPAAGAWPLARRLHSAVFDAPRNRMLVVCGYYAYGNYLNDLWALDLNTMTWTELTPSGSGPSQRHGMASTLDTARSEWLLFGGFIHVGVYFDDLFALDLATESFTGIPLGESHPHQASWATMTYLHQSDQAILFGGLYLDWYGGDWRLHTLRDTWFLDRASNTWSQVPSEVWAPPSRAGHVALPYRGRYLGVFGGLHADEPGATLGTEYPLGDLWVFDPATSRWEEQSPSGAAPSARALTAATADDAQQRVFVFGGTDWRGQEYNDLSLLTLTSDTNPWTPVDIGVVCRPGQFTTNNSGVFTVSGSGEDIEGTLDGFHFVHKTLAGDGQIVARVVSLQNTDVQAEAGLMIREGTNASARHVFLAMSSRRGAFFRRRLLEADYSIDNRWSASLPAWLCLRRMRDTFVAHISTNGTNWDVVWWTTLSLPAEMQAGLAVTSHRFCVTNTAVFDNVTVGPLAALPGASMLPRPKILLGGEPLGTPGREPADGFKFLIAGNPGESYTVLASPVITGTHALDLSTFSPSGAVTNICGVVDFSDTTSMQLGNRFYRVRQP